jgi:cyclophilin family peptidyl-prolyl cis-trans isomerase/HEAT repeat protein
VDVARIAVRALGRFERPALISDIVPSLHHANPAVRAEAANAIGQAAQGWKHGESAAATSLDNALALLVARLKVEDDFEVRATIAETIGRLPYRDRPEVEKAARALVEFGVQAEIVRAGGASGVMPDRLGVAKGLEALVRMNRSPWESSEAVETLKGYVTSGAESTSGARVRRLALQALITAGAADDALATKAAHDADAQVRRLAMRAAPVGVLVASARDVSPGVRMEAIGQLKAKSAAESCVVSLAAVGDPDTQVALVALDQLSVCAASEDAVAALEGAVKDFGESGATSDAPRAWHRAAHALVALAAASPDRASEVLGGFTSSRTWQLRMYAARAARILANRAALEKLAVDDDDNVREAAMTALRELFSHDAESIFVAELTRPGYQVLRAAAIALDGTPNPEAAIPALRAALDRLVAEGHDNSHDARTAIQKTLDSLEATTSTTARNGVKNAARRSKNVPVRTTGDRTVSDLNAGDFQRLAAARARVTIRGVGAFDLLLLTSHAQATVLRFAKLAESGYYNGLTFHRVVPNFVIQGGSPGANEYIGDSPFMLDELGRWPHVRGAVGISTRGRDTGDGQLFVDLVDNPRLDHEYTVFAQVLNGLEVIDQILEGDVIERIDIIPGS